MVDEILQILFKENFTKAHQEIFNIMSVNHADVNSLVTLLSERICKLTLDEKMKGNLLMELGKMEEKCQVMNEESFLLDNLIAVFIDERNVDN